MSKKAPSTAQLLVIAGFALSCFGILLFLWITFGGPTPFKAKSYEVNDPLRRGGPARPAVRRADLRRQRRQSPERSSATPTAKLAIATIEHRRQVRADPGGHPGDPAHQDAARRDLRRTDPRRPRRPEARRRRHACPAPTSPSSVQIDEIFRTFDPHTRAAFQEWMQERGARDRGPRARPLHAPSANSTRPSPNSTNSSASSTPSSSAVSQLFSNGADRPRRACAAAKASSPS